MTVKPALITKVLNEVQPLPETLEAWPQIILLELPSKRQKWERLVILGICWIIWKVIIKEMIEEVANAVFNILVNLHLVGCFLLIKTPILTKYYKMKDKSTRFQACIMIQVCFNWKLIIIWTRTIGILVVWSFRNQIILHKVLLSRLRILNFRQVEMVNQGAVEWWLNKMK